MVRKTSTNTSISALDRVNVRRLLIAVKSYISQVADTFII